MPWTPLTDTPAGGDSLRPSESALRTCPPGAGPTASRASSQPRRQVAVRVLVHALGKVGHGVRGVRHEARARRQQPLDADGAARVDAARRDANLRAQPEAEAVGEARRAVVEDVRRVDAPHEHLRHAR
eukprot:691291-Prymnesium_polylepis.1